MLNSRLRISQRVKTAIQIQEWKRNEWIGETRKLPREKVCGDQTKVEVQQVSGNNEKSLGSMRQNWMLLAEWRFTIKYVILLVTLYFRWCRHLIVPAPCHALLGDLFVNIWEIPNLQIKWYWICYLNCNWMDTLNVKIESENNLGLVWHSCSHNWSQLTNVTHRQISFSWSYVAISGILTTCLLKLNTELTVQKNKIGLLLCHSHIELRLSWGW